MGCKVVIIGGGSYAWTPTLAGDLFLREGLKGSHLALVDIDREAAEDLKKYCELMVEKTGSNWKVTVDELDEALEGADYVCVSISTGGLEAMHKDYTIPEKYGIYHTVGDTVGPGGISRTLRNVPVFLDIARKMEKICPDAWMIHVTNPLSQLTRVVNMETSIKCVGLCHNYVSTITMLKNYLKADLEDINAVSVGVNHFTWLKNITCKGKPVDDKLSLKGYIEYYMSKNGEEITNTTDDVIQKMLIGKNMEFYLNFELFERFGYMPVGSSNHVAENFPYYCNSIEALEKHHIRRKGVLPRRQMLKDQKVQEIRDVISGKKELPEMQLSNEGLSIIVEALHTGEPARCIVSMPNIGQITNLPKDVVVETWAEINGSGIFPLASGDIPGCLTGYMQTIIDEQETAVKAALTGDRRLVAQAMAISPQVQNKDIAEELANELLEANKELLPQFKF